MIMDNNELMIFFKLTVQGILDQVVPSREEVGEKKGGKAGKCHDRQYIYNLASLMILYI